MPNLDSSLPSEIDIANHGVPAVANPTPHPDRTKLAISIPPILAYPGAANGVDVGIMSLSKTRDRRDFSTVNATVSKRPDSSSAGIIIGAIVVVLAAVVLLLLLPLYFKRRSRTAQKTHATDEESGISQQASYESRSDATKKSSASHSGDLQRETSGDVLSTSQLSSETALLMAEGERTDLSRLNLPGTVSDSTSPSSHVKEEENRVKALPMRPPRLLLRPKRVDDEERQDDSLTMTRSSTVKLGARASRGRFSVAHSMLPNPWDGDEMPGSAGFERVLFRLPSFPPPSALPTASFKTGLPRHSRESRALSLLSSEVKTTEDTQARSSVRVSAVERVRPSPAPVV
ncbi:hypothetical protein BJV78DRAFT_1280987 [Lactifluus subvellereus]|nr:hypothetical protein BJV78DRAFT_1280987 [Lactifluus subvellereus]